jgi:hypothetical protein
VRREECVCGGVLYSYGGTFDGIRATVEEHNDTPLHVAWEKAGGFDSGLILPPLRRSRRSFWEPESTDPYEGLLTGTMG